MYIQVIPLSQPYVRVRSRDQQPKKLSRRAIANSRESTGEGKELQQTAIHSVETAVRFLFSRGEVAANEIWADQEQIEAIESEMLNTRSVAHNVVGLEERIGPVDLPYLFNGQKNALTRLLSAYHLLLKGSYAKTDQLIAKLEAAIDEIQSHFASLVSEHQEQIEKIEKEMEGKRIQLYLSAYEKISGDDVEGAKVDLKKQKDLLVEEEARLSHLFEHQKNTLERLLIMYNQLLAQQGPDGRSSELIGRLKTKIDEIQTQLTIRDSSLHSMRPVEHRIRLVQATLLKRIDLVERRRTLDLQIASSWFSLKARYERWRINRTLGGRVDRASEQALPPSLSARIWAIFGYAQPTAPCAEPREHMVSPIADALDRVVKPIKGAPTLDQLKQIQGEIEHDVASNVIYGKKEAQTLHKAYDQELAWGASHLHEGLTSPDNWLPIRRLVLLTSSSGSVHAFVNETTPCDLSEGSGVPSGLRKDGRYSKRTTNFHKTTFYMVGDRERTEAVSYRGGQFPTQEAAQAALLTMMNDKSNLYLHINSLLTPTALSSFSPDRQLLAQHKKSLESTLSEIHAALSGASDVLKVPEETKISAEEWLNMHLNTYALSNFGVNDAAVGEKLPFHISLGWHTATRDYNNEAAVRLGSQLRERLVEIRNKLQARQELTKDEQKIFGHLGSLVSACQELREIWDSNSFAKSRVGDDPFKMPALWGTVDLLAGVTTYTNCMSGKDRTGEVVAATYHRYAEFVMMEHTPKVGELAVRLAEALNPTLCNVMLSIYSPVELLQLLDRPRLEESNLQVEVVDKVLEALGLNDGGMGPLEEKEVSAFLQVGTRGISTRESEKPAQAPEDEKKHIEERDRRAKNRRPLEGIAGPITRRNTSIVGTKVKGKEPLLRYSSGFAREALLAKLVSPSGRLYYNFKEIFCAETGINELGKGQQSEIQRELKSIEDNFDLKKGRHSELKAALTKVMKKVERLKRGTITPSAKVAG